MTTRLLKDIMAKLKRTEAESLLGKALLITCGIAFAASMLSFLFAGELKTWFVWLVIYIPFCWGAWTIYAICYAKIPKLLNLLFVWIVIAVSAASFLLSLSVDTPNWTKSSGADIVVYIIYVPAIGFISNIIPQFFNTQYIFLTNITRCLFPSATQETAQICLQMSLFALLQAVIIVILSLTLKYLYNKSAHKYPSA